MLKKFDVLCIGSAVVDHFLETQEKFKEIKLGDKVLVKNLEVHSGGGATNAAAALSKMGLKVKMLTKLGMDKEADFVLNEMKQYSVKNICLHRSKKGTNFSALITSEKEKDRVIYAYKGASQDLSLNDFKKSQLRARWIYLGSLMGKSLQTAKQIVQDAKKKKIKIFFNPSLYLAKNNKLLKSILEATSILVLNKEEAQALLGKKTQSYKQLLLGLHKFGPETVIITNGPKILYASYEDGFYSILPPNVKVKHTAGAGDSFNSGFLAGIIKKYSFEDSLKFGIANSLSVIQHVGTKNKLLNEKEALQVIKKYKLRVKKC
jgi:sugar/nucleoside kinase (ribokinase family)